MIRMTSNYDHTMPGGFWDLHCDLPMYLGLGVDRTATDEGCPCQLDEIKAGGISTQICAIFTAPEPNARKFALRQLQVFSIAQKEAESRGVQLGWALEHAGGLFQENWDEDWRLFDFWTDALGPCSYIGPTWNGKSRFGGGCGDESGLTEEGRLLLSGMAARGVPLDFSHMSDTLARDCLEWLDSKVSRHPVLASHSNLREVCPHPRNLPSWLAQELIERRGIIGLCWYPLFIGSNADALLRHVEILLEISPDCMASGADLFAIEDPYPALQSTHRVEFFSELSRSSHMQNWHSKLIHAFGPEVASRICGGNARAWFQELSSSLR